MTLPIKFSNFNKDKDLLIFEVSDCNSSFVNSLRRIIISEVTTISFNVDDYENSDLKVIENNSSLHNEFLLSRLGLIPIFTNDIESYDPSKYKFTLKKENKTFNIIDVTTEDFEILNLETNKLENTLSFFPKNDITGDSILITRLKPNPNGTGEKIHIEGTSSKGIGKEHIRFSPVSTILFTNKIDPDRYSIMFEEYKAKNIGLDEAILKRKFQIEESERCFHIDSNGDPNKFEFKIETCGVIPSEKILIYGLQNLSKKLKNFLQEFEKSIQNQESLVKITESKCVMKSYDISVENESHTLGHLLQSYINIMFNDIFIGYLNPHPLEEKIVFRIKIDNISELKDIFIKTIMELIKVYDHNIELISKEFGIYKETSKPKGKPKILFKPTTKPVATKPVATKPVATKPVATKPVATKPTATKVEVATKPATSKQDEEGKGKKIEISLDTELLDVIEEKTKPKFKFKLKPPKK